MARIINVALLALFTAYGADAVSNFRGFDQAQVSTLDGARRKPGLGGTQVGGGDIDWKSWGLGVGIGAVVAAILGGVAMKFLAGGASPKESEDGDAAEAVAAEVAKVAVVEEELAEEVQSTDYQALIKVLAQKVAQEVGPKLSKAGGVKNVLDSRMSSFTENAKNFLLNEMNGTAGAVLQELEAPEAMMLLDWNHAVEANFPPASILVAGVLSPSVLKLMSVHHLIQMVSVGLPVMILCICALYIDWAAPCTIPTIFPWLFTQTALAFLLVVGHGALFLKGVLGNKRLAAKAEEVHEKNSGSDGANQMRDEFVGNTVILQEALLVESEIRHSFWNMIVGVSTFAWVITTVWNLVLVAGWTFIPGVVAFHPDAAEVAKDEYCGAWMTVLVLKINILLAVLFLFFNLATVVQWVCDMMIESQGFQETVLNSARDMDRAGSGLPVMELLVKAFLLRGSSDTLNSRLSVVQKQKAVLETERAEVTAKLAALSSEITTAEAAEAKWKGAAVEKGGALADQVKEQLEKASKFDEWKGDSDKAMLEATAKAKELQEQTTKALEELWEQIQQMAEQARNSETAKALASKYSELEAKMKEAMNTLQDPEFQKQLMEAAQQASNQAKQLADDAISAAKDPEMQKKLNQMAHDAMAQAQKAAEEVAAAANDPEKRKQLQEAAQKAMAQAKEQAAKAAEGLNDPELQKKMKEAAQNAMDQAQLAAESAIAAAQDPELQNKLKEAAQNALEEAKAKAKEVADAASDPELQKKLQAEADKLKAKAAEAAEQVKAAAPDEATLKKLAEAAQNYKKTQQ